MTEHYPRQPFSFVLALSQWPNTIPNSLSVLYQRCPYDWTLSQTAAQFCISYVPMTERYPRQLLSFVSALSQWLSAIPDLRSALS